MSPRRQVQHTKPKPRSRRGLLEMLITVVAVAAVTALAVWLIRPTGAAANQPRIATVLLGALLIFGIGTLVARTPDRPSQARLQYWTFVAVVVVLAVSIGALVQVLSDWDWPLTAGLWIAGVAVGVSIIGEVTLLIRRFSRGSVTIGALFSLALALILGAAAALLWPGGVRIERPPAPTVPTTPVSSTAPSPSEDSVPSTTIAPAPPSQ